MTFPTGIVKDLYPKYTPDGSAILFSRCPGFQAADCDARSLSPNGADDTLLATILDLHAVHFILQPTP